MEYAVLVANDTNYSSWEDCYKSLAGKLLEEKKVKPLFWKSVYEREKQFPTGLQITPRFGLAIPHASDPTLTIEPALSIAILDHPISVNSMANADENVMVSIVVMLALVAAEDHLKMLQALVETFQNDELIERLLNLSNTQDAKGILEGHLGINKNG
jgi:PTS system galactitol-specific IIA component